MIVRNLVIALAALSAGSILSSPVKAQGMAPLGEEDGLDVIYVESARRVATPISEISRSVTVITTQELDIQRNLNRSTGSVLAQTVPGFSPSTEALSNFGQQLRGRNFLTLIDGVPQGTPLRNGQRSLQSIDIDAIERIEVIRGGTAVYGFGADGGIINYITKRPRDGEFNALFKSGFSFSTEHVDDSFAWNTHLQGSGRLDKLDFLISGTFVSRNNTFDADGNRRVVDPIGAQGGLDESDEYNVLAKLGYDIAEDQRFEVLFNIFSLRQDPDFGLRSSQTPGELFSPPTEPEVALPGKLQDAKPGNESTNLSATYTNDDLFGSMVRLQTFYQQIDTTFTLFPGFPQTEIESEKFGARLTVETPVELETLPFDVIWGVDYLADDTGQFAIVGDESARGDQDAIAGFLQLEVPLNDIGLITAGLRHEDISIDVTEVEPTGTLKGSETLFNASGSLFVTDEITLFGGFSQAFSPGDILRVLTDGSFTDTDEVELEFVKTDNYEVGVRTMGDDWRAELVGFYSTSTNGASFDADLNILTRPEKIWGIELAVDVQITEKVGAGGTFSWSKGRVDVDGDGNKDEDLPTTRVTPEKITAYIDYQPLSWWNIRAQVLYSGTQNNDSTAFGGGNKINDYVLVDLFTSFDTGYGEVGLSITNLFNNAYLPVINQAYNFQFSNVQGPGRRIGLNYRVDL